VSIRGAIYREIDAERDRQDRLFPNQIDNGNLEWAVVLAEECGEVAHEVLEQNRGAQNGRELHAELVQVAAVAIAWLEFLVKKST
jgi:NTP pyrophosphatase (non-canonical NTP hydrolase)